MLKRRGSVADLFSQLFVGRNRRKVRRRPQTSTGNRQQLESLEARTLLSSVTISTDDIIAGPQSITATDDVAANVDNVTINSGITLESTGDNVTIDVGDDFFLNPGSVVSAFGDLVINLDAGNADSGSGGNAFLQGTLHGATVSLNGNVDNDSFGLEPAAYLDSPLGIDGAGGNDILDIDLTGVTSPQLAYSGLASGTITSTSHQTVSFVNTEVVTIFAATGKWSTVSLDLSTHVSYSDGNPDSWEIVRSGSNLSVFYNTAEIFTLPVSGMDALEITGSNDDDTFTVSYAGGAPGVPVTFNGGGGTDTLSIEGDGATTAIYTPDASTSGDGVVDVSGTLISFTGLAPVDISGMASATLSLPGADDVLVVSEDTDFATGLQNAIRVSGTSGGVAIETVAFYNNTTVTVDTSDVDGTDSVSVTGAANGHTNTNFAIRTGGTATDGDQILLSGDVTTSGSQIYQNAAVTLVTDVTLTSSGGASISFLNATIDGAQQLAINTAGLTNLGGEIGATTPLVSLTTDSVGGTTINSVGVATSGVQAYGDAVTLSVDSVLTASAVVLATGLNASPSGFQGVDIVGDLTLGDGGSQAIGNLNPLGYFSITGVTVINTQAATAVTTAATGATGDQTYQNILLQGGSNVTLAATGGGDVIFAGLIDGGLGLTVNSTGVTSFDGAVGSTTPLTFVSTNAGGSTHIGADITTSGIQQYSDDLDTADGITLTGSTIATQAHLSPGSTGIALTAFSGDVTFGNSAADHFTVDIAGKAVAGVNYDSLQVTGLVNLNSTLDIVDSFVDSGLPGDVITLISNDGTDAVIGQFAGLANGAAVTLNGQTWRVLYDGGDGNDVVLVFGKASLSIDDVSVLETSSGTTTLSFDVTLDSPAGGPFRVTYATADNTADSSDYTAANATLNFAGLTAGEVQTIFITVAGDAIVELDETFLLTLTNILDTTNVQFADASALGTILNDDSATLSVLDVTHSEGDSGTTNYVFTVTLDAAVDTAVSVEFATADGSATTADADYVATSGTLNFTATAPGETQTITVLVNGDTTAELDETFLIDLTNLSVGGRAVTLATSQVTGAVIDDDRVAVNLAADTTVTSEAAGTVVTLTATAESAVSGTQTFSLSVSGSGITASDYTLSSSTLTIADGATVSDSVTLTILDDALVEALETATITLTAVSSGVRAGTVPSQSVTIADNDQSALTIDDVSVSEGDSGTATLTFTVTSSAATDEAFTVDFATTDGSAEAATDYTSSSGTLNFAGTAGETQTVSITVSGDTLVELDETFSVVLSGVASNGRSVVLTDDTGIGTITNDDSATVSIAGVSQSEGNSGTSAYTFIVTLDSDVDGAVAVTVSTVDGTAVAADGDYTAISGLVLNFAGTAGETQTVTVSVSGDTLVEADETFQVEITDVSAGGRDVTAGTALATGEIVNDDAPIAVNLSTDISAATEAGATVVTVTVTADSAVTGDQTVTLDISGVSASDYTLSGSTITIADGQTTGTATFTVVDDAAVEILETAGFSLSGYSAGITAGSTTTADVAITDNDTATISIDDVSISEGDSGATDFVFTVTLSAAVDAPVVVDFASADGTAAGGGVDFADASGTLTFSGTAGETQTITISVTGDQVVELDENFLVNLSNLNASGRSVTIVDDQGRGTILNDDSATLSISDVTLAEGNSGTTLFTFTVTLDKAVDTALTVSFSTADGTALAGTDYTAIVDNTLAFNGTVGETKTLQVLVTGETDIETDETFLVNLSNVLSSGRDVALADSQGLGTIVDDDGIPVSLSVDVASGTEVGQTVITLTATANSAVLADETIDLGITGTGITTGDYVLSSSTITILNGQTTGSVTLTVQDDQVAELMETLTATLQNASLGISVGSVPSQQITITDNDAATLSIAAVSIAEGDSGTSVATVTVTLDNAVDSGVTVDYATSDETALAGTDYESATGTLTFVGTAGETQTFQVTINGDETVELDETFLVSLLNLSASGRDVTLATSSAQVTITNDDTASLTIDNVTIVEGNAGTTDFVFTVTLDKAVDAGFQVDYATVDGSATAGEDFTAISGATLTFTGTAGETQTVTVTVNGDLTPETDETFTVALSNIVAAGRNVTIGDAFGLGTITDDDGIPVNFAASASTGSEASGSVITLVVSAASAVSGAQTIDLVVTGTGITGTDYQLGSSTLTIPDGATIGTGTITILNDTLVESLESLVVTIVNPSAGISLGTVRSATIDITSDDTASISIDDVSVTEGNAGTVQLTFTVTLDNAVDGGFTVDYGTADGTATVAGSDYSAAAGTLTFAGTAGETQTITVTVNSDLVTEADETVLVNLSNIQAGTLPVTIADAQGTGTILNDDAAIEVNVSLSTATASESAATQVTITVTASAPVVGDQTVDIAVSGTDITSADYTLDVVTVTILSGQTTGTAVLTVVNDGLLEGTETATVSLTSPSVGITLGSSASASLSIQDSTTLVLDPIIRFPEAQPTISWTAVNGAVRYEVWFSRVFPNAARVYLDSQVTDTSWTPPEALVSGFYRYWVRAFDGAGNSTPWSAPNVFEIRPTLVSPLNGSFVNPPTFQWNAIPFASSYQLFLRTSAGDSVISNISGTSYTPAAALPAGTVSWWIRATEALVNRGWSDVGKTGVTPQTQLTGPASPSGSTPTFSWIGIQGAGRYVLHVQNLSNGNVVIREDHLTGTQYTTPTPLATGTYRVWVKAIDATTNAFDSGLWSRPFDLTIVSSETDSDQTPAALDVQLTSLPVASMTSQQSNAAVNAAQQTVAESSQRLADADRQPSDTSSLAAETRVPNNSSTTADQESELALLDLLMGRTLDLTAML
ncbi:MAG: Calx-beta domain-containing protein [Planctomycetaceae bacterium]